MTEYVSDTYMYKFYHWYPVCSFVYNNTDKIHCSSHIPAHKPFCQSAYTRLYLYQIRVISPVVTSASVYLRPD